MVKSMVLRELHTLEETTMDKVRFLMSDTGAPFTAACREALEQKGVDVTVVEKDGNKVLQKCSPCARRWSCWMLLCPVWMPLR